MVRALLLGSRGKEVHRFLKNGEDIKAGLLTGSPLQFLRQMAERL
jgi:hypothetical protein